MLLVSKLASMLLMIAVGFIIVKCGILKVEDSRPISTLVVYVLTPCLIIRAFQVDLTPERMQGFLASVIFTAGSYILWIVLCKLLKKPFHITPIDEATLVYSNVGNLTLPLISWVLGEEMVFYVGTMQLPFILFVWTHGYKTIQGEGKINWKKILLNTNLIALYIGIALMIAQIRLPEVLETTMAAFTNMVGPASMLVAGMVLAGASLRRILLYKRAFLICFGRLIVFPITSMLVLYVSGVGKAHPEWIPILMAIMIGLAAPPASTVSQLAVVYNKEAAKANIYNVMGLLLCIVTIPLIAMMYRALFGM